MMADSIVDPAPPPAAKSQRAWLRLLIGLLLLAVLWYFVGRMLFKSFAEIDFHHLHLRWSMVAASFATLMLARLTNAINCQQALAAMGQNFPLRRILPVIWITSMGRYVPGKMAVVAGAVMMLMRLGIALPQALASLFLSTALMILLGLITSTPLLFTPVVRHAMPWGWVVCVAMTVAGAVALHPRIFMLLCNAILRRAKRPPFPDTLLTGPFLRSILVTLLRIVLLGVSLWLAIAALVEVQLSSLPLAIGSAAFASVAGFLAVFAPAGFGVHEGIYMLTLKTLLGPKAALLVVMFRFLNIAADAATGLVGTLMLKNQRSPVD